MKSGMSGNKKAAMKAKGTLLSIIKPSLVKAFEDAMDFEEPMPVDVAIELANPRLRFIDLDD